MKHQIGPEKKVHSQHDNQNTKYIDSKRRLKPAMKNEYITEKGRLLELHTIFSMESLKVRRIWTDVLQTLRDHGCDYRNFNHSKW